MLPLLGLLFVFAIAAFICQRRLIVVRRWFPAFVLVVTLLGFPKTVLLPAFHLAESLAPSTGGPEHFSPSIAKLFDFIAFGAPFCLWFGLPIGVNLLKGVRFSSAGMYRFAYLPVVALLIGLSAADTIMFTLQSSEWYRGEIVARDISPNGRLSVAVTQRDFLYRLMWWESQRGGVFVHESAPYEGDDNAVPPEIRVSWSTDSLVCRVFANTELLIEQKFTESRDSLDRSHLIEVKPPPLELVRAKILALQRHATDQDGAFIYKKVVTRMLDLLDEGRRYGMPDEEFYMARGILKNKMGEYNEATACFKHVIDASPTNIEAYIGIAVSKDHLEDEAEAIGWYSRAIDIATAVDANADAKARLGWLYYQRAFVEYSIDKARSDEDYKLAKQHGYVSYGNDF